MGQDHYKRVLGQVYVGKRRINKEMVAAGCAWHSDYFAPDDTELAAAQRKAQAERKGLWQEGSPLPPWKWRKLKRTQGKSYGSGTYWVSKAGKIHNPNCNVYGASRSGTFTDNPQGINCKSCGGTGK